MKKFTFINKDQKLLFYEIPLLIESKLMNYFNLIIFVRSKKKLRLKRFMLKKGNKKLFTLLDKQQMDDSKKIKLCDHVVLNDKNIKILKKNLSVIIKKYE